MQFSVSASATLVFFLQGAAWVMGANATNNVFRAPFSVTASAAAVVRARLFICGLGYAKAFMNGDRTVSSIARAPHLHLLSAGPTSLALPPATAGLL